MASNIFNQNKPVKHSGRNAFDLSSQHNFVLRTGIARPVVFQHTVPNSSFKIQCSDILRTAALQQAAFLSANQEIDFYFVPYQHVYSRAHRTIFSKGEDNTPLYLNLATEIPTVYLMHLIEQAAFPFIFGWILKRYAAIKGSDLMLSTASQILLGLYGIYFKFFSQSQDPEQVDQFQEEFLFDTLFYDSISVQDTPYLNISALHFVGADSLQLLSSLGYGDYYQMITGLLYATFNDGAFASSSNLDNAMEHFATMYYDWLQSLITKRVTLIALASYQRIWKDYFRDSIVDNEVLYTYASSLDVDHQSLDHYMWELIDDPNFDAHDKDLAMVFTYLRPRRIMYKKDLSSGLYPSTQEGNTANLVYTDNVDYNIAKDLNVPLIGSTKVSQTESAYAIKFTLALQRYRESLMRAGNRTKDLLMAEFGVKSQYIDDHFAQYLGSFGGSLDVNRVNATAETGDYSVGDIAGNILSSLNGDTINFTCNEYGMIIGVMYIRPNIMHNAFGVSKFNFKTKNFDFYHEDFENLGLQPVGSNNFLMSANDTTLGFGSRNFEYKQNLDFAHDTFCLSGVPNRSMFPVSFSGVSFPDGAHSNYNLVKPTEQDLANRIDRSYIYPDIMNPVFKTLDDGTMPEMSQFICHLTVGINAVLPMSVLGTM